MPPNMRRYLPMVLIAFVVLFGAQALFKKKSASPSSAATTAAQTITAIKLINSDEQAYKTANGRFTSNLADLVQFKPHAVNAVVAGVSVELDASTDGHTYLARVASSVLSLTRVFAGAKMTSESCVVLKSGPGVACPVPTR